MKIIVVSLLLLFFSSYAFAQTHDGVTGTIKTAVGEEFVITLDANATTGYEWHPAKIVNSSLIKFLRSEYVPDKTGLVGSPGRSLWTFKAVRVGKAQITFEYTRSWEKNVPPVKEATYIVDVQNEVREQY